jgi:hypothetical protein
MNGSRDQRLQLPVIGVERRCRSIAFDTLAFERGLAATPTPSLRHNTSVMFSS